MGINWFPGHMYKAEKQLQQKLKRVDAVLELRDTRIPFASTWKKTKNSGKLSKISISS